MHACPFRIPSGTVLAMASALPYEEILKIDSSKWNPVQNFPDGSWSAVVLYDRQFDPTPAEIAVLKGSLGHLCASVIPLSVAGEDGLRLIEALQLPCPTTVSTDRRLALIPKDTIDLLAIPNLPTVDEWFAEFERRANRFGLRHFLAPGLLVGQPPEGFQTSPDFGKIGGAIFHEVHQLHAQLTRRDLLVLFDGTCLDSDVSTGTHQLLTNLILSYARVRPDVEVWVVAKPVAHSLLRTMFQSTNVRVATKKEWGDRIADVLYRGYQIYLADELAWCRSHCHRLIIGQLDMIAFDNRTYFPTSELYAEARNVIRASLLTADAVTCISEFGRQTVLERVPDLRNRCVEIMFCGTDHVASTQAQRPPDLPDSVGSFVLCLAGSFGHKNRPHAVRTFACLTQLGYGGHLVFAGSQPYYGGLHDLVEAEIKALPVDVQRRIIDIPTVPDPSKWWLLRSADAVLYPSVVEGYGLVPFEAATVGTPCLAHRSTALAEILGDDVILADSWDPHGWAQTIFRWTYDATSVQEFLNAFRERANLFTWEGSAQALAPLIDRTVASPKLSPIVAASEGGSLEAFPNVTWSQTPPQRIARFARRTNSFLDRKRRAKLG
jgi:glycosyltransferase involved in cell wall biosynthesis